MFRDYVVPGAGVGFDEGRLRVYCVGSDGSIHSIVGVGQGQTRFCGSGSQPMLRRGVGGAFEGSLVASSRPSGPQSLGKSAIYSDCFS